MKGIAFLIIGLSILNCSPATQTYPSCRPKPETQCVTEYPIDETLAARIHYRKRFGKVYEKFILASVRQMTQQAVHSEIAAVTIVLRFVESMTDVPCSSENRLSEAAVKRLDGKRRAVEAAGGKLARKIEQGCYSRGDPETEWLFRRTEHSLDAYEDAVVLSDGWLKRLCGCYGMKMDIVGDDGTVLFTSNRRL